MVCYIKNDDIVKGKSMILKSIMTKENVKNAYDMWWVRSINQVS